jgi:hypothetical protein
MAQKLASQPSYAATLASIFYASDATGTTGGKVTGTELQTLLNSTLSNRLINNVAGTSYILTAGDVGKVVTFDQASACTLFIPDDLGAGFFCDVLQLGDGQITIEASGGSVTFNDPLNSRTSRTSGSFVYLFATDNNDYSIGGDTTQNPFKQFRLVASHDFSVSGSASGASLDISSVTTKDVILRLSKMKNDTATNIIFIPRSSSVDRLIRGYNAAPAGYGISLENGATSVPTGASAVHDGQWTIEVNSDNPDKPVTADYLYVRTAAGYNNTAGQTNNGIAYDSTVTGAIATSATYPKNISGAAVVDEIRVEVAVGLLTAGLIEIWEAN